MVLLIIIPMKNGYKSLGRWTQHFQANPFQNAGLTCHMARASAALEAISATAAWPALTWSIWRWRARRARRDRRDQICWCAWMMRRKRLGIEVPLKVTMFQSGMKKGYHGYIMDIMAIMDIMDIVDIMDIMDIDNGCNGYYGYNGYNGIIDISFECPLCTLAWICSWCSNPLGKRGI